MKKMCKRVVLFVMVAVLCLQSVIPVMAGNNSFKDMLSPEETTASGMQGIDISEAGVEASYISEEEMQQMGVSDKDIAASVEKMNSELCMKQDVTETVSANGISVSGNAEVIQPEGATYATQEDAAAYLRSKILKRAEECSIRIVSTKSALNKNISEIMAKAFAYDIDGAPIEGDYMYWHMAYYGVPKRNGIDKNKDGTYTVTLLLGYRTTAEEEAYVTGRVNAIINQLNLRSASLNDYQKVRAIYDYIMSIVQYDKYHYETNLNYNYMYTAYAALADGYAVCQAYATLFYRLCEEVGISARVICGNDYENGNPSHGWNIVKIGNYYYNVDATWDDADTPTHVYFLKNMTDFIGHQRNRRHVNAEFEKEFPTAKVSYILPEERVSVPMTNVANVSGALRMTDGSTCSLAANGKEKIILFLNGYESGSVTMLKNFYALPSVKAGKYEAIVADISSGYATDDSLTPEKMMAAYKNMTQTPAAFKYCSDYTTALAYRNQYAAKAGYPAGAVSMVVVIDTANRVRYVGMGRNGVAMVDCGVISGLTVRQTKNNAVNLTWNAYAGATDYLVMRKSGSQPYCCVGSTAATAFADEVKPGATYTYQIFAIQNGKEIAKSGEMSVAANLMLPKKGATYVVDEYKYKVLKSTAGAKEVAFAGVTNKKLTVVLIPATVKIDGLEYKVTQIASNALKGNKKVKTVSIGSNVTKIGSKAFYKAKKLTNIVVKTKKLKKVGKKALSGISSKAVIRVPSSKLKKYKKVFKGKGQKSSVKIKK